MTNYDLFSKHFDELMGNPIDKTKRIENYIKQNSPKAKSVLDIGCGTGSILYNLPNKYDKTGIDLSANMLSIAKQKVKSAKFYQYDMTAFKFEKKFDVILCIYDSINHLLHFKDWEKLFHNVKSHLNENGLFIFDVNTTFYLKKLSKLQQQLQPFGKNGKHFYSISVTQIKDTIFNWSVKIFEPSKIPSASSSR